MITAVAIAYVTAKYGEEPKISAGALFVDFIAWLAIGETMITVAT